MKALAVHSKIKILHVFPTLASVAGAENALLRQIAADSQNQHHLICNINISEQTRELFTQAGAVIYPIGTFRLLKLLATFLAVRNCLSRINPDVLVGWMYIGAIWASLICLMQLRLKPLIWSLHHSFEVLKDVKSTTRITILMCRYLVRLPVFITYVSDYACRAHENIGYPKEKSQIIYNPIEEFYIDDDARPHSNEQTVHIGMAARWDATKDHATLIAAVGLLHKTSPVKKWVLHLCGTDMISDNSQLSELIAASGLQVGTDVLLYGHLRGIQSFYAGLTIYVQSSRCEAFGMAAAEAMASGVPAIASRVGGLPEVIGDDRCLFAPGDVQSLATIILRLTEPLIFDQVARTARSRAQNLFSTTATVFAYQTLYQQAVGSHG